MVSGNGPVDTVLTPAVGRVNRSRESGDLGSRQGAMDTVGSQGPGVARPAVPPGQSNGSGQGLMKQGPNQSSQAYGEVVFENILEQVWPVALRKSPAPGQRSHVDDSGPSSGQARGVQPVQAASPGGQPAGVGPTRDESVRLASGRSADGINLAVQWGVNSWSALRRFWQGQLQVLVKRYVQLILGGVAGSAQNYLLTRQGLRA
jgi:hypothetical protein